MGAPDDWGEKFSPMIILDKLEGRVSMVSKEAADGDWGVVVGNATGGFWSAPGLGLGITYGLILASVMGGPVEGLDSSCTN